MNRDITEEELVFYHLKYGASERIIRGVWALSNTSEAITTAFEKYVAMVSDPEQMRLVASIASHMEATKKVRP
jgi:hypothetical protein